MHFANLLLAVLGCGVIVQAKPPSWFVPCYRDDPNFNACALKVGQAAIPTLVQGDKKLNIPTLDPLFVTELVVDKEATSTGLAFTLNNVTVTGLGHAQLQDYRMDFDKRRIEFIAFVPHAEINFHYEVSGMILILPITGSGPGNITLDDSTLNFAMDYDLVKRKNGKEYMVMKDSKVVPTLTKASIKLENLFGGDKRLGDSMNHFINDNWKLLINDLIPFFAEAFGMVLKQVYTGVAQSVSFDESYPTKI